MAIAIQTLRDEGVLDVGGVPGTSFVYVVTRARLCMFHAVELPQRRLDEYGAQRAVYWLVEQGMTSGRLAADLGVHEGELRRALLAIGYERWRPEALEQRAGARDSRKVGNRRGPLVRVGESPKPKAYRRASSSPSLPGPNPVFNDGSVTAASKRKAVSVTFR